MAESTVAPFNPVPLLSKELSLPERGVAAVVQLLTEGSTVPFIARYRKEATGGLDEVQIRTIEERRTYLVELEERRQVILSSIAEQGKLTDALQNKVLACTTKAALEDLYLPYKPKRRTRGIMAKERGLEPLAKRILAQERSGDPQADAKAFINPELKVESVAAALAGARDIIAEMAAEDADIRATAREVFAKEGKMVSEPVAEKTKVPTKFEQYYNFEENVATIPSHRFLALRRGEREGVLKVRIDVDAERVLPSMRRKFNQNPASPYATELEQALADGYGRLLAPSVETDVRVDLKMRADRDAVEVFANNLRNLLLSAPLGDRSVVGVDPGLRTGCKCVALSNTGKFLENITVYLAKGEAAVARAGQEFLAFVKKHNPSCVAVGNGTGGRETEAFVRKTLAEGGIKDVHIL
ncbi:MAG TPA: Tex-like N-terminal domain-containing protein, partial [Myxococcota bacterium]|nr:Tex-like N-terminal domain-containing protein [Myxococcota bacterium]